MLWPSARARRAISGCAAVFRPRRKNVARTHSFLSVSRILVVVPGQGPSSNVSTSSFSPSGSVEGNCLRPTRGIFLTSTSSTRSVPSASELPGHSAATAVHGTIAKAIATRHIRVMKHSLPHSSVSGKLRAPYTLNSLHEAYNRAYKHRASVVFCRQASDMLDQEQVTNSEAAAQLPRNKDGSIRKTFVKSVARRIKAADGTGLKALVGNLHESDMGALIEALPADQRQRLV